jgi:mRNA interferase MazF
VKRGELWTVSGGPDYVGKPPPAVILQDDRFEATASVTVCPLTSDPTEAPLLRLLIDPSSTNGLQVASRLMVDKITTVARTKVGTRVGQLAGEDLVRLNRAVMVFLGLAGSPPGA